MLDYIENEGALDKFVRGKKSANLEQKKEWMRQINGTVQALHQHGIVWGDVKPANVVIDKNMDAWVVDFGGGWSPEYVDQDKMETVEGDLQGLLRMKRLLLGE